MAESNLNNLVVRYAPLVYSYATKLHQTHRCERQDLIQYGFIGLLTGLQKVDWERNPVAFLASKIRYAMLDGLEEEGAILHRTKKKQTLYYTETDSTL